MKFIKHILVIMIVMFAGIVATNLCLADNTHSNINYQDFPVEGLRGRIDFWKSIFAKHGKNFSVFHHRSYPEITYSVLDFSEYAEVYSPGTFEAMKKKILAEETKKIERMLLHLASGAAPRDDNERRVKQLFEQNIGPGSKPLRDATQDDQIRSQTGIMEKFKEGVKRSGRYMHAMEQIFKEAGLPVEVARLPLIESSFDYDAYSSVGAAGIWQFMPSTARQYMRVTCHIDERLDPIVSTRGAARYLKHAFGRLERWPLAITSYNHGITGVLRGAAAVGSRDIRKLILRYDGKSWGFASKNFYVEFMAALEIEQNPMSYFPDLVLETPVEFDEVRLERGITFNELVRISGTDKEILQNLNRALRIAVQQSKVSIPNGFLVKVPKGKGMVLIGALKHSKIVALTDASREFLEKKSNNASNSESYRVSSGDTLGAIANAHKVSIKDLMSLNDISDPKRIKAGQLLKIPHGSSDSSVQLANSKSGSDYHLVKSGETLYGIAKKYNLTLGKLKSINPELKSIIKPGDKVQVK
jgi:membrane-bound lytic murein transglycosylase D